MIEQICRSSTGNGKYVLEICRLKGNCEYLLKQRSLWNVKFSEKFLHDA